MESALIDLSDSPARKTVEFGRAITGQGTTFFETKVTAPGTDEESPVLGQHSTTPTKNLFVTPGTSTPSFDRDATYSSLAVVAHERANWGQVVHAVHSSLSQRGKDASDLAERLYRAFDRGINSFEARNPELFRQNAANAAPGRSDGAQDRHFGQRPSGPGRTFGR